MTSVKIIDTVLSLTVQLLWINVDLCHGVETGGAEVVGWETTPVLPVTTPPYILEMEVIGPFRLWMILGFVLLGLLVVIVALCCIFDCRIPRTKQEIEAENQRKQAAKAEFVSAAQKIRSAQKTFRAARVLQNAMALQNSPVVAPQSTPSAESTSRAGSRVGSRDVGGIEVEVSSAAAVGGAPGRTASQLSHSADTDFQLYEKPPNYGRRIRYEPTDEAATVPRPSTSGSRQFKTNPNATAQVLASLPRHANSNV